MHRELPPFTPTETDGSVRPHEIEAGAVEGAMFGRQVTIEAPDHSEEIADEGAITSGAEILHGTEQDSGGMESDEEVAQARSLVEESYDGVQEGDQEVTEGEPASEYHPLPAKAVIDKVPSHSRRSKPKKVYDSLINSLRIISKRHPYDARTAAGPHEVDGARKLNALVYKNIGYIKSEDIDAEGFIVPEIDPYKDFSQYFVVTKKGADEEVDVLGASRKIQHGYEPGFDSFQMYKHSNLTPEGVDFVARHDLEKTVEISALCKKPGESSFIPLVLFRELWQDGIRNDEDLWLFTLDKNIYGKMQELFSNSFLQIGEETELTKYKTVVIPLAAEPQQIFNNVLEQTSKMKGLKKIQQKAFVRFFTDGLESHYMTSEQRQASGRKD